MATLSNQSPFQTGSPFTPTWFGIGVGIVVGILGTVVVTFGIANFNLDPGSSVNSLRAAPVVEQPHEATLQEELETVRHRWQMNSQALMLIQADPRWEMPEQEEHLTRAMQETEAIVRETRLRIEEIEQELDQ